jgi:hypothetical protein
MEMEATMLEHTDQLAMLAAYARAGDKRKFVAAVEVMDWTQYQPAQLIQTIDLALSLGLASLAIKLAQQGVNLFPQDERVQMAARVLSPPVAHELELQPPNAVNSSTEWLQQHASQYRTQWVAIRDGQLLGSAASLKELAAATPLDEQTVVTKVL